MTKTRPTVTNTYHHGSVFFVVEAKVVMCFYGWMHEILMQKNVTYIATCDTNLYYAVRRFYYFHIT